MQAYANVLPLAQMRRQASSFKQPLTPFEKRLNALFLTMCASAISHDAIESIKAGRSVEAIESLEMAENCLNLSIALQSETVLA